MLTVTRSLRLMQDRWRVAVSCVRSCRIVARLYRDGPAPGGGLASLLYVGEERYADDFKPLFADRPEATTLFRGSWAEYARDPKMWWPQTPELTLRQTLPGETLVRGGLVLKPFLDAHLPLAATSEEQIANVRSKAHRRRMRAVARSQRYRAIASQDPARFDLFYTRMYEPYVRTRFGAGARVDSRETLAGLGGSTLLVLEDDEPVCGALLIGPGRDRSLIYHRNGFSEAHRITSMTMAMRTAALELAVFGWARDHGCRQLDLGFTRGVLSDGILIHKRRLGSRFTVASYSPTFFARVRPAARPRVFRLLPMLFVEGGRFEARLGYEKTTAPQSARRWKPVAKQAAIPGLSRVWVHTDCPIDDAGLQSFETAVRRAVPSTPVEILRDG